MKVLACASAALLAAANAAAQPLGDVPPSLEAFTKTAFYAGLLDTAISKLPPEVFRRCPTLVSTGSRVVVLSPVTFGADGFPSGGRWLQRFPVSGCGNDTVLNLFFQATPEEKVDTIIGDPGSTIADPVLQRDALTFALLGLAAARTDCKRFVVTNTKFESFGWRTPPRPDPGVGAAYRPWWETWTLAGCGRSSDVPIDFAPDAGGTQVTQPGHIVDH